MSILSVEHLSHGFGDRAVFHDVSFRLLKGEHIGLVGANGEGKSTFMNIITGKLQPDEGKVEWARHVRAGYLDQHTVLEKGMTIRQVLKSAFAFLFEMEEQMKEMFGDIFQVEYDRDSADYVYEREKLAALSGKKLHGKRNHINRFKDNHQWSYEKLNDENQLEALAMLMEWKMQNCAPEDLEKHEEICVSKNSLIYYKELGLVGGILRADGKIVGLSLGEPAVNPDTFVVHIEKAFPDVQGAYPMINQQFVLHEMEGFTYVNREEDMGEEGLRKAKMSYRPAFMLEKGFLRFRPADTAAEIK